MSKDQELKAEYDAKLELWKAKQSTLEQSVDRLNSTSAKLESNLNDNKIRQMAVRNPDGTVNLQEMEATFRDNSERQQFQDIVKNRRIEDEIQRRSEEDFGTHDPEDEAGLHI